MYKIADSGSWAEEEIRFKRNKIANGVATQSSYVLQWARTENSHSRQKHDQKKEGMENASAATREKKTRLGLHVLLQIQLECVCL